MKALRKTTDQWLTITQAAHVLGVNHAKLRRACDRGLIEHHLAPSGRYRRIAISEVRRLLATPRYESQTESGYERLRVLMDSGECGELKHHPTGEYLTTTQVARIMRCTHKSVASLIDRGTLPGWKIGNDRRVYPPALIAYMESIGMPQEWIDQFKHERGIK